MKFKLLILICGILLFLFFGWSAMLRNFGFAPTDFLYPLQLTGEWIDVNFLIFGAPEKQQKHLELAERRLQEFLKYQPDNSSVLNWRYEKELARALFMAEQLALLDRKFISDIEAVYDESLKNLGLLWADDAKGADEFALSAQRYNEKAIKLLLHKHQYGDTERARYKELIQRRVELLENLNLVDSKNEQYQKALAVLAEGKELEWAYDLLSSIRK